MSILTLAPRAGAGAEPSSTPGLLTRVIERGTAEQTRRAKQVAYRYLAGYSDERLAELGFSTDEIAEIRATGRAGTSTWM